MALLVLVATAVAGLMTVASGLTFISHIQKKAFFKPYLFTVMSFLSSGLLDFVYRLDFEDGLLIRLSILPLRIVMILSLTILMVAIAYAFYEIIVSVKSRISTIVATAPIMLLSGFGVMSFNVV